MLLTAPSSHEPGREPDFLAGRFLRRAEDLVPLHQEYVAIVREVAATHDVVLCDLARGFEALPTEQLSDPLLRDDGIHPTPAGDELIARLLYDCFESANLLSALGVE